MFFIENSDDLEPRGHISLSMYFLKLKIFFSNLQHCPQQGCVGSKQEVLDLPGAAEEGLLRVAVAL
jgi:hypothetical protein